jgi:hypothetical protein
MQELKYYIPVSHERGLQRLCRYSVKFMRNWKKCDCFIVYVTRRPRFTLLDYVTQLFMVPHQHNSLWSCFPDSSCVCYSLAKDWKTDHFWGQINHSDWPRLILTFPQSSWFFETTSFATIASIDHLFKYIDLVWNTFKLCFFDIFINWYILACSLLIWVIGANLHATTFLFLCFIFLKNIYYRKKISL